MSTPANPLLVHWQWYDGDTGTTVNDTTSFAGEDTTYALDVGEVAHLRVKIGNDGDMAATAAFTLQYLDDSSSPGTWVTITTSSSMWQVAAGTGTDADATTERLTTTARTYTNGEYDEGDGSIDVNVASGDDSELVWCIAPQTAGAGKSFVFRVLSDTTPVNVEGSPGEIAGTVNVGNPQPSVGSITVDGNHVPTPSEDQIIGNVPSARLNVITRVGLQFCGHTPTIAVGGDGNHTVEPTTGSMAISSDAPSAEEDHFVDVPTPGALVITGIASDPLVNHIRGPPTEGLVLNGIAPSLATTVPPNSGSLILGSDAPSVGEDHVAQPSVGSMAISSETLTLGVTAKPSAGSLQFNSDALGVGEDHVAQPSAGALVITGQAPSVPLIALPSAGSLTLDSDALTVGEDHVAQPSVGAIVFGGDAVSIGTSASPSAGSIAFGSDALSVGEDHVAQPSAGSIVISSDAVSAGGDPQPSTASLQFNSDAVAVGEDHVAQPSVGAITLGGITPSLDTGIPSTAGSVAFGSDAPTVPAGEESQPTTGALALNGVAPAIGQDHVAQPAVGAIAVTGQDADRVRSGQTEIPTQTGRLNVVTRVGMQFRGQAPSLLIGIEDNPVLPTTGAIAFSSDPVTTQDSGNSVAEMKSGALNIRTRVGMEIRGQAPTVVTSGTNPSMLPGSLGFSSDAPNPSKFLKPDTGSLVITGRNPFIGQPGPRITVPSATLSIVGSEFGPPATPLNFSSDAPNAFVSAIEPSSGSIQISSDAVALDGRPATDSGSLSVASTAPLVFVDNPDRIRGPLVGSISLTEQSVARLDTGVPPAVGSVAISSDGATVDTGIPATAGSITTASEAPTLDKARAGTTGSVTISSDSVSVLITPAPSTGSVAIASGVVRTLVAAAGAPPNGELSISSQAPTALTSVTVLPSAGSITVTPGAAPAFHLIAPQAGSLTLTGRVPFTVESGLGVVGPIDKPGISKGGGRDIEKGGTGLHSGPTAPGITRGGSRDIESSQDC